MASTSGPTDPAAAYFRERRNGNLRGAAVMLGAAISLIGMAYVAMTLVTGPHGWATRAATDAFAGEAVLVSAAMPVDMED